MTILPKKIFLEHEQALRHEINNSKDPFLGMFAEFLTESIQKELIDYIMDSYDPVKTYIENFFVYPALLSTLLVKMLLHDFGSTGHFAVYPIIKKIIGGHLSSNEKFKLWRAFRHACLLLGLPVSSRSSGSHYMVEEYLGQTGLPLQYAARFAEKALQFSADAGLPEEEDPESLAIWQQSLSIRLTTPFSKVARKAIEKDDGCYYSSVFLRLFNSQPINNYSNFPVLERIFANVIINGPTQQRIKKISIPQILIRELEYGLFLPGGDNSWTITIDDVVSYYNALNKECFIPFNDSLVKNVQAQSQSGSRWEFQIWEDQQPNRLLIFSKATGKLVQRVSLADEKVALRPGDYMLLLHFVPGENEQTELLSDKLNLYLKHISLAPAQIYELQRGPVTLLLKADDIPVIKFTNDIIRGVGGNEFIPSYLLGLNIYLPDEFIKISKEYVLLLKSKTLGDIIEVPFLVQGSNTVTIDIELYLKNWLPGVARLTVEIFRKESNRAISRQSAILWNGLNYVKKRTVFYCDRMPHNLLQTQNENVIIDPQRKIVTYQEPTRRLFKMYFQDGRVTRYFTWAVPGIFLNLQTFSNDNIEERNVQLGMRLSVNRTARKNLQIFASKPAVLKLGEFSCAVDFSRLGSKNIPLASLLEYTLTGDNKLFLIDKESSEAIPLVELVTPSTVENYQVQIGHGLRTISFSSLDHINGFKIIAENLITIEQYSFEFDCDANVAPKQDILIPGINVQTIFFSQTELTSIMPDKGWPSGFWLFHFYIKVGSQWRVTTNANNEIIADGLLKSDEQFATTHDEVFQAFEDEATSNDIKRLFFNLHNSLMHRYGIECWENLSWLKSYWTTICIKYFRESTDTNLWSSLLELSVEWPDETIAEGHVPTSLLNGILLKMYCFNRSALNVKPNKTSMLACMSFFPKMDNVTELFKNREIDLSVLFGFNNAPQVQTGATPNEFVMTKYQEALIQMSRDDHVFFDDDWLPGPGSFLSFIHYRYAVRKLIRRYTRSLSIESDRRGRMLGLIQQMSGRKLSSYVQTKRYNRLVDHIDLGLFMEKQDEMLINDEIAVQQDHQQKIIHFLSLLAQICRAEVHRGGEGSLHAFLQDIKQQCNLSCDHIQNQLGYLIFLGEDIFAFYLMLWELVFTTDVDANRRRIVAASNTASSQRRINRV